MEKYNNNRYKIKNNTRCTYTYRKGLIASVRVPNSQKTLNNLVYYRYMKLFWLFGIAEIPEGLIYLVYISEIP